MKITTFCFCILGTMLGVWMADLGAWASAGGIWVICIILAIDGAARPRVTKEEPERQRTLSTLGGLARSTVTPPAPPRKAAPFKVGDRVRRKSDGKEGFVVMNPSDDVLVVDLRIVGLERYAVQFPEEIELISEKAKFKVGDRVRITGHQGGACGTVSSILGSVVRVKFDPMGPYFQGDEILFPSDSLELICEKQP